MSEKIYYDRDGVIVTGQRISIRGRTFFTANIASVDVIMDANRLVWGLFGLSVCWATMSLILSAWVHFLVSAAVCAAIVKWLRFRLYFLVFDTTSGRVEALKGERDALLMLKECIEGAITQKDLT